MARDDDEVWRSIVDNYGDRAELDEPSESAAAASDEATLDASADHDPDRRWPRRSPAEPPRWDATPDPDPDLDEDRFVPPPPPPLPTTTTDRMAAWCGVFGAPAVLLVSLVLGIRLPEIVSYALVLGFVGGFLYLVVKMNREPRDPDDNGAVL